MNGVKSSRLYRSLYRWYREQTWLASLLVMMNGNRVTLDNCRFVVDAPDTTARLRAEYWFDRYEASERRLVKKYLERDLPVIELGGGIGVLSCVINKLLIDPTRHLVLEANPTLHPLIERNRALNRAGFKALNQAYAATGGNIRFQLGQTYTVSAANTPSRAPSNVLTDRFIDVGAVSMEMLTSQFGFERCNLVCDIEGSEFDMIRQEMPTLAARVRIMLMELHTPPEGRDHLQDYLDELHANGFKLVAQDAKVFVFRNTRLDRPEVAASH